MFRLLSLPVRLPLKISWRMLRLAGLSNAVLLALGIGIGLLIAPTTGAELRRRLKERMDERAQVGAGSSAQPASEAVRA